MTDPADLAALVASRICHDLISPIGAIGNGVELLTLGGSEGEELALLSDSAAHANARIRFFRIAFGAAGPSQRIGRAEVASTLTDLSQGGRIAHDWTSAPDLPRREVRLAFLLLLCLETALIQGGRIAVMETGGGWHLQAEGPRLRLDPDLWSPLQGGAAPAETSAAQVQFALVPPALAALSRQLSVAADGASIRLTF